MDPETVLRSDLLNLALVKLHDAFPTVRNPSKFSRSQQGDKTKPQITSQGRNAPATVDDIQDFAACCAKAEFLREFPDPQPIALTPAVAKQSFQQFSKQGREEMVHEIETWVDGLILPYVLRISGLLIFEVSL